MKATAELVYVVDDEEGMRRALARLLRSEGFEVRLFASADDFLQARDTGEPACMILDVSMPGIDGMEFQSRLVRTGACIPIVFLTGHGDIPMSVRAMKAGALDFLTKPVNAPDLLDAVRLGLSQAALGRRKREKLDDLRRRYQSLTPREREVMTHVVSGKLNKQIAAQLGTGEQNIKIHRGRVMEKMGMTSLAELVRSAEWLGLADQGTDI